MHPVRPQSCFRTAVMLFGAVTSLGTSTLAAPAYNAGREIYYPGSGGGYATIVTDINNEGDLSGYGHRDDGWIQYNNAFKYNYDTDNFTYIAGGRAWGLNDAGQVVGQSYSNSPAASGAFVWTPGSTTQYLGQSKQIYMAYDINNSGRLVGRGGPGQELLAWDVGSSGGPDMQGFPNGYNQYNNNWESVRATINNKHVVAYSARAWFPVDKADRALVKPTKHPGGPFPSVYDPSFRFLNGTSNTNVSSYANSINDHGTVAGQLGNKPVVWGTQGWVWTVGANQPGLGLSLGETKDINNHGVAVGSGYFGENFEQGAFIWRNGYAVNLNDIIDLPEGHTIRDATGINDKGQIVAVVDNGIWTTTRIIEPNVGSSRYTPRLPDSINATTGAHVFTNVTGGQWFDPVSAYGFHFEMLTAGSAFEKILEAPVGFGTLIVEVAGHSFTLEEGAALDLLDATEFTVKWDPILFETLGELAFPVKLDFTTPLASFSMTPLVTAPVPEPTTLGGILAATMLLRRRR